MERLLYISHRVPYPPDKGERVRAFHEIKALSKHFRITLAFLSHDAADPQAAEPLKQWCEQILTAPAGGASGMIRGGLSLLRGRSATEGYFRSSRLTALLRNAAASEPFDVALGYSSSTLPYLLAVPARRRIMDLIDVDSLKWASYADSSVGPKRWLYLAESHAVAQLEAQAVRQCDAVVLVSEAEVEALHGQLLARSPQGSTYTRSQNVLAVGNGVDTEYFHPPDRPYEGPPTLVFTGQMDYRPNVEGVCWFVKEVWPLLRQDFPDLRFNIVGRNPTPAVRRLADIPGITVTGTVPDIRPHLWNATAAVCPLMIARGIQNKVLEAMASGLPVVGSPEAIKGLDIEMGKDAFAADTPLTWHRAIRQILSNVESRRKAMNAALSRVTEEYVWDSQMAGLIWQCIGILPRSAAVNSQSIRAEACSNELGQLASPFGDTRP